MDRLFINSPCNMLHFKIELTSISHSRPIQQNEPRNEKYYNMIDRVSVKQEQSISKIFHRIDLKITDNGCERT